MTAAGTLVRSASSGLDVLRRTTVPSSGSRRFPWLVTAANAWILAGLLVDGRSHIASSGPETFFTPWHALLYSGVAAAVAVHLTERLRTGGLPAGYRLSLVGGLVVGAAGAVDMVWHTVLGVEADLAALLSPPHLLLITAGTLVFAGPLRAALQARDGTPVPLPAAFSAASVVTGLAFFTQYANPFTHLYPVRGYSAVDAGLRVAEASPAAAELRQVAGVAGVVLYAVLLAGAVAVLRSRGPLPAGAAFVVVAVPAAAMTTLRGTLVLLPAAVLAGLAVEVLARRRHGGTVLATAAPALLVLGWVLTLASTQELDWGVELLTGTVCSAAAAGFLTGWLLSQGTRSRA